MRGGQPTVGSSPTRCVGPTGRRIFQQPIHHAANHGIGGPLCLTCFFWAQIDHACREGREHSARVNPLPDTDELLCALSRWYVKNRRIVTCGCASDEVINLPGSRFTLKIFCAKIGGS